MAQFYSLEEAADRLGIPVDEFKRRIKTEWTSIRPFRDGATLRFRTADIDELARSLGAASDPGLTPGPIGSGFAEDSDELDIPMSLEPAPPIPMPKTARNMKKPNIADDLPLLISDDDNTFGTLPMKAGSDSDVRLDMNLGSGRDNPELTMPTEEISIDLSGPSSAIIKPSSGSGKLSAPKSGTKLSGPESSKIPSPSKVKSSPLAPDDSSSEFELSLDPSNDSLELELTSDSSEEVDLGGLELSLDPRGGQSGINLGKPTDSGLSLEKKGPKTGPLGYVGNKNDADSDVDFELSLDAPGASGSKLGGPKSFTSRSTGPDSDSEFELTLDDNSGDLDNLAESLRAGGEGGAEGSEGAIFETDFDLPSLDDDSQVVAEETDLEGGVELDMNDLEEADDDSASQVLVVEDDAEAIVEDDDMPRPRKKGARSLAGAFDDDDVSGEDLDDSPSASGALRNVRRGGDDDDYPTGPVQTIVAQPAKWGPLPAIVLFLTLPLMFVGSLMGYESVRGMWGYHQPSQPGNLLVRGLAENLFTIKTGD
jgi:hypothetical protein